MSTALILDVKRVVVTSRKGFTDEITVEIDAPSPMPNGSPAFLTMRAAYGTGATWVLENLGVKPEFSEV